MEKKYSVIIPVYNSEKTIDRCLQSLLKQKRNDVEILVVNDGSKDRSAKILAGYAAENPGIVLINQENSGVSKARNAGLAEACGKYVLFVDSDDFVSEDYFSALDELGKKEDSDLIVFASNTVGGQGEDETELYKGFEQAQGSFSKLRQLLGSRKIMSPWNKRFKADIIKKNNIHFISDLQIGEDFNFCLEYALRCKSIDTAYKKIYCVDISDQESLSRKYRPHLDEQMTYVFRNAAELIQKSELEQKEKDELLKTADYLFVKNIFTCTAEGFKKKKPKFSTLRAEMLEMYKKFRQPLCTQGAYISAVHRMLRLLVRHNMTFLVYCVTKYVKGKAFAKYLEG